MNTPDARGAASRCARSDSAASVAQLAARCSPAASRASRCTTTWRARSSRQGQPREAGPHFEEALRRLAGVRRGLRRRWPSAGCGRATPGRAGAAARGPGGRAGGRRPRMREARCCATSGELPEARRGLRGRRWPWRRATRACASSSASCCATRASRAKPCAPAGGGGPRAGPGLVLELARHDAGRPARMAEAEKAFREACRPDDRHHHHAYNLGLALLRQGRPDEARPYFERPSPSIRASPGARAPRDSSAWPSGG